MSTELDQAREMAERIARRVSGESETHAARRPKVRSQRGTGRCACRPQRPAKKNFSTRSEGLRTNRGSDNTDQPHEQSSARDYPASAAPQKPVLITHSPWLAGINSSYSHPSQEKFGVEEATVSELVDFFEKEKICNVEPGGKPCDHCAMCSSRGF